MKRIYLVLVVVLMSQVSLGQEFSFSMYFEDAAGNKDTLVLGYDVNGTDGIDPDFGEIDLSGTPLNPLFDVRISDGFWNDGVPKVQTKKQIIANNSCTGFSLITIDIVTNAWPVTAHWDAVLFEDTCRNGSVFTSMHPGGWWDVGSPSNLERADLANIDEVTFTSNLIENDFDPNYAYINEQLDTIPVFWQTFADSTLLTLGMTEWNHHAAVQLFPNPAYESVRIANTSGTQAIVQLTAFDLTGRQMDIRFSNGQLDVSAWKTGIYMLQIALADGGRVSRRLLKQ
ncbi:MAG: T9SS type A sorting domain-containing protein [Bacteroidetes bacterium]|nr:T9SS type A sorting domain-containing protein [Bacteroidota bacterium]